MEKNQDNVEPAPFNIINEPTTSESPESKGVSCTYFWHFFSKQISIFENGYRQVQLP